MLLSGHCAFNDGSLILRDGDGGGERAAGQDGVAVVGTAAESFNLEVDGHADATRGEHDGRGLQREAEVLILDLRHADRGCGGCSVAAAAA